MVGRFAIRRFRRVRPFLLILIRLVHASTLCSAIGLPMSEVVAVVTLALEELLLGLLFPTSVSASSITRSSTTSIRVIPSGIAVGVLLIGVQGCVVGVLR